MGFFIADGQGPLTNRDYGSITDLSQNFNQSVEKVSPTPVLNSVLSQSQKHFLDIARFGDFLTGHAQVLATVVAIGFSIYTFVLGMKVSRLALKLILKKENVVFKFGTSLALVGMLSVLSVLPYNDYPFLVIVTILLLAIAAYILPVYWLISLSQSLSRYFSPDSVITLIKENLMQAIAKGYKVEIGQRRRQQKFEEECEKAGIDIIPGFASLYESENQIAIKPDRKGYINNFDERRLEKISQLLQPLVTSQNVTTNTPNELRERQRSKIRIFHTVGSFIDPESINQTLSTVASVDKDIENITEILGLLKSLFEVSKKDKYALEVNDLLIDLKNHILEIVKSRNLDDYESNISIFPELLREHYRQCKNDVQKQSLSYLGPIREITAELLENTLQIKSAEWTGKTVSLLYSMLSIAIENDDHTLFQQFVTLFRTMYSLSRQLNLKESLWSSHHLFYEMMNYQLIPKLEREIKQSEDAQKRKMLVNKTKSFIWSMFIILSENLKVAYQQNDTSYTTSVVRMLKGSLKYLGENRETAELDELKDWYNKSLIRLWFNQLGYAFTLNDKRGKSSRDVFQIILSATNEYSIEELSIAVASDRSKSEGFNFPDFAEVLFDEESEYSGTAVFMGDPNTSNFKAYIVSAISRSDLTNQKSTQISQYYLDEIKKIVDIFKSGKYVSLVETPQGRVINSFISINETAFTEYKTQTEQSIIDAVLDTSLIDRFKDNTLRGWKNNGTLRLLLKGKVTKQLNDMPDVSEDVLLRGFNQRHSKEYFIVQDRFGYPRDYGYEYGKALSEGEDEIIYEKLLASCSPEAINVKSKNAEDILDHILTKGHPTKNTILFVPYDFWEFQYRNSKNFIAKYKLPEKDKYNNIRSFMGYYKHDQFKIPLIYSPTRKRKDDKIVLVDISKVGKMTIYRPHSEAAARALVFADIKLFTEQEIQSIITANPSDLHGLSTDDIKKKLSQEVALRVLERYSFEVTDTNQVKVFKLDEMSDV